MSAVPAEDWDSPTDGAVEVLDPTTISDEQQRALDVHERQVRAVDAVAAHAIESAGTPGRDEFVSLCMQAKLLSMSSAVPKGLRGNAPLCLHVAMIARDLGISPATGVNLIDYIPDDKKNPQAGGQLSLSPELINGQLLRLKLGRILPLVSDAAHCVAVAVESGGGIERDVDGKVIAIRGEIDRYEFNWDMAMRAGLVDSRCPDPMGAHWVRPNAKEPWKYENKCNCRSGYVSYPERMHWWRASGYLAHNTFPQAMLGMYTAEELGAYVDEDGHAIDPTTVQLPEGYNELPVGRGRVPGSAPPEEIADKDVLDKVRLEMHALDKDGKKQLVENWGKRDLPITDDRKPDPYALTARQARIVNALLRSCEAAARARGWDQEAATEAARAKLAAMFAPPTDPPPEAAAAPETAAEAVEEPPVVLDEEFGEPLGDADPPEAQETAEKAPQSRRAPAMPPGVPEEIVDGWKAKIEDLSTRQVTDELTSRGYSANGSASERAERLLKVWASEAEGETAPATEEEPPPWRGDPAWDHANAPAGTEDAENVAAGRVARMTTGQIRLDLVARGIRPRGDADEVKAVLIREMTAEILASA